MCIYTAYASAHMCLRNSRTCMLRVYINLCHTFHISFAKRRQSSNALYLPRVLHLLMCTLQTRAHTQRKRFVCVCDPSGLVYFSCRAADEWRVEGSTATRTHGNSPSTLSATTLFIPHIYLSVQQRLGKSLTRRPPGFLNATDKRERDRERVQVAL